MSKTALSVFLKRQLTFHSPPLQQALQHSEQGGGALVDSLLEMQLLTQEQYQTLSRHFARARLVIREHPTSSSTLPSFQTELLQARSEADNHVFWDAMQAVQRAVQAPDLLRDLPESYEALDSAEKTLSPVTPEQSLDSLKELDETISQMELSNAWQDEDTSDLWNDEGDRTLPQVSFSRIHFSEELTQPFDDERLGPLAGRLLSNTWLLNRIIGEGAMGVVYEGQNTSDGRIVAIKILRENYQHDEEVLNRFCREATVLQDLQHKNILEVYELGYDSQLGSYMVMEMLKGCDLDQFLKYYEYEIPMEEMIYIFGQVCDAMDYIHSRDIVHRDLKPENIFLTEQPDGFKHVTIVDFGIVKIQDKERLKFTQTGATLGTPQFVSPEQAVGGTLDERSDVYSFGVIVFKSLTGRDLFEADSPYEYLSQHIYTPAPKLSSILQNRKVPRSLDRVLAKALSKKKKDRFESMNAMKKPLLQALDDYRENLTREGSSGVFQAIRDILPEQIKSWGVRVFSSSAENPAVEDISDTAVHLNEVETEDDLLS